MEWNENLGGTEAWTGGELHELNEVSKSFSSLISGNVSCISQPYIKVNYCFEPLSMCIFYQARQGSYGICSFHISDCLLNAIFVFQIIMTKFINDSYVSSSTYQHYITLIDNNNNDYNNNSISNKTIYSLMSRVYPSTSIYSKSCAKLLQRCCT